MTIKVGTNYFSAGGNVPASVHGANSLAAIARGLAIDVARLKTIVVAPADFTDNSTGVSAGTIVDLAVPTAAFDASASGGSPLAGFNTAITVLENAMAVVAEHMNDVRTPLGLTALTYAGTVAVADTIPAITKVLTATSGTSAVDYATGKLKLAEAKAQLRKLVAAYNEVLVAIGVTPLVSALTEDFTQDYTLAAITDATASATGASSISDTVVDTFLTAFAANIASLATKWNATFPLSTTTALSVVAAE